MWTEMAPLLRELADAVGRLVADGDRTVRVMTELSGISPDVLEELRSLDEPAAMPSQVCEPSVDPLEQLRITVLHGKNTKPNQAGLL